MANFRDVKYRIEKKLSHFPIISKGVLEAFVPSYFLQLDSTSKGIAQLLINQESTINHVTYKPAVVFPGTLSKLLISH